MLLNAVLPLSFHSSYHVSEFSTIHLVLFTFSFFGETIQRISPDVVEPWGLVQLVGLQWELQVAALQPSKQLETKHRMQARGDFSDSNQDRLGKGHELVSLGD